MSVFTNESEADQEVIKVLRNKVKELSIMSYLKLEDGTLIKVNREDYIVVSREELERKVEEKRESVKELERLLADPTPEDNQPIDEVPQQPTNPEQVFPEQPVAPEAPVNPVQTDPATGLPVPQAPVQPEITIQ